jgi:hypothetical protein
MSFDSPQVAAARAKATKHRQSLAERLYDMRHTNLNYPDCVAAKALYRRVLEELFVSGQNPQAESVSYVQCPESLTDPHDRDVWQDALHHLVNDGFSARLINRGRGFEIEVTLPPVKRDDYDYDSD